MTNPKPAPASYAPGAHLRPDGTIFVQGGGYYWAIFGATPTTGLHYERGGERLPLLDSANATGKRSWDPWLRKARMAASIAYAKARLEADLLGTKAEGREVEP